MNSAGNIIYFENDEEFVSWALISKSIFKRPNKTDSYFHTSCSDPNINLDIIEQRAKGPLYFDFDFTQDYYDELDKGTLFCIKHYDTAEYGVKAVTRQLITSHVCNLIEYMGSEDMTGSHIQPCGSGAERNERLERIKQQQLEWLREIFETGMPPTPAFKSYHKGAPDGMIPYVSYSDLLDYKYNIRAIPSRDFWGEDKVEKTENGKIIAHYDSLEELVDDGWMLD